MATFETSNTSSSDDLEFEENNLSIFPNPISSNVIYGNFNALKSQKVEVYLLQLDGKIIHQQQFDFQSGENRFSIPANIQAGVFILKFKTFDKSYTHKLLVIS